VGTSAIGKILSSRIHCWLYIRKPIKKVPNRSIIWKSILNHFPLIGKWLISRIQSRSQVIIGKDPCIGSNKNHLIPDHIFQALNRSKYTFPIKVYAFSWFVSTKFLHYILFLIYEISHGDQKFFIKFASFIPHVNAIYFVEKTIEKWENIMLILNLLFFSLICEKVYGVMKVDYSLTFTCIIVL